VFIKIHGGTVKHGDAPLCTSCRKATSVRGASRNHDFIDCSHVGRITFPVTSCSAYSDRRQPSLLDMQNVAWVLRSDSKRRKVGFVPARDLAPHERLLLYDDWVADD
jgi:hypothetical protein